MPESLFKTSKNMRKIMTATEKEAKDVRTKRTMAIIVGVIMLVSSAGYAFMGFGGNENSGNSGKIDYNGVNFEKAEYGLWKFTYGEKEYQTLYNPLETANVSISAGFDRKISNYYNQPLYISAEPIDDISGSAGQEILRNFDGIISRSNYACSSEDLNCTQDYAVKNCSNDNMIIFKKSASNDSAVSQRDKCAVITYALGDEEKAADAFLFKAMGIV
jgi:hypothetical protein